jgi:SAM-dependent methyltransferase
MKRSRKKEWFDDDSLWRVMFPYIFSEARFAAATKEMQQVLALAKPNGKSVLDLGCGPGRCAIPLARRGFSVTGVDRTGHLLATARRQARAARVRVEWVRADMRDFVRPGAFDFVLSMFTSFGYFDDKCEDVAMLGNMFASLRPGGTCLVDVMGKECLARIFLPIKSEILPDGTRVVQHHKVFDDWTRIWNKWIIVRHGRTRSRTFHHTVYSGQELRERLESVGFAGVRLYGDLEGGEYGTSAKRLVAVARKPKA